MSLVARRRPGFGWPNRRVILIVGIVIAFAALGGGGWLLASSLRGTGSAGTPPSAPPAVTTPTPTATSSPSPTPAVTPTPSPSPPPSALAGLSCTIAVAGRWAPGSGGFLSFPGAQFKPDPASSVTAPDGSFWGLSHSLALNRWLPVPRDWMTPDGTRYVYMAWSYSGPVLQVVDSQRRTTSLPLPTTTTASGARVNLDVRVLSAEADGVYVVPNSYPGSPGLWRIGYDGRITHIATDYYWQAVGFGYAYGTVTSSVPDGASNILIRQKLSTGARDQVFTQPGLAVTVFGFDAAGTPVVQGKHGKDYEIWLADPAHAVQLLTVSGDTVVTGGQGGGMGPGFPGVPGLSAIGDAHGLWIATTAGLYLYTPAAGVEKASEVAGPLGSTCR